MIKLSVVIITYNEEKNIGRCIESLKDIADEIVVVDSFSTDKTKEICQGYNVRFFEHHFLSYSEQKNHANSKTSFDYIFSIDADEVVSEELKQSILKTKSNFDCDVYVLSRLTNYCGKWIKHCGWYPDRKSRLWKKDTAMWDGTIHETLVYGSEAKVGSLKGDLWHYSYHSIHQHIAQVNKFTDIGALAAYNKGKRASLFKIVVYPFWKFVKDYLINLGFLDGYYGFVICIISAHATFVKYIKMNELQKQQ